MALKRGFRCGESRQHGQRGRIVIALAPTAEAIALAASLAPREKDIRHAAASEA
jgi:hypothetical protein